MARSFARQAYPIVAGLFAACAVIQVFLAGLGVFESARQFATHAGFGYLFGWLTLIMLVLALIGREPRRIVGQAALILVLFAMQSVFVLVRDDLPAVAALHPLNGFAILGFAIATTRASWRLRGGEGFPSPAGATASSVVPVESL
jgi:hypothetical protein